MEEKRAESDILGCDACTLLETCGIETAIAYRSAASDGMDY